MSNWIKWWKDKTFLTILGIVLITMAVCFCVAYFSCAWWLSIILACLGGVGIRKVIIKRIDKEAEE